MSAKQIQTLKAWREERNMSQRAAAKHFGMSQSGYRVIEAGIRHPRPKLAVRLMQGTGVSLATLMGIAS